MCDASDSVKTGHIWADRKVACSTSDRQGSNFESCLWRAVSFPSSHHPQEVLLAQFSLYVHKSGLKPDSFHFTFELQEDMIYLENQIKSADFTLAGSHIIIVVGEEKLTLSTQSYLI